MISSIAPAALSELHEAATYYAERGGADLGLAFVTEFERVIKIISTNPMLGSIFAKRYRSYPMRRFPYSVFYYLTQDGSLRVLAIAHQRRRPKYWTSRV